MNNQSVQNSSCKVVDAQEEIFQIWLESQYRTCMRWSIQKKKQLILTGRQEIEGNSRLECYPLNEEWSTEQLKQNSAAVNA